MGREILRDDVKVMFLAAENGICSVIAVLDCDIVDE